MDKARHALILEALQSAIGKENVEDSQEAENPGEADVVREAGGDTLAAGDTDIGHHLE